MRWSSSTIPSAEPPLIGILGGTFDPVHRGHLAAATQLLSLAGLQEVWLMPNAHPPHRAAPPVASAVDRLRMVEVALAGQSGLRASSVEVDRGGVSYTIDTLRQLRLSSPAPGIRLLLGFDAALHIQEWHQAEALLREADFVIFSRPLIRLEDGQLERLGFPAGRTRVVMVETPPISARKVRALLAQGQTVESMLVPPVLAYIREHGLYPPTGGMG